MAALGSGASINEKEFHLSDRDFNFIRKIVGDRTGIVLSEGKRDMVYGRLTRRLRHLGLDSFSDYIDIIKGNDESELIEFTNAITTNLTSFFREPHHFEHLEKELLPRLIKQKTEPVIRIWSAGCSSGEEPYSLAMTLLENVPANWDIKILATDLDSHMVERGKRGVYPIERVEALPGTRLRRWVRRGKGDKSNMVKMSPELQQVITFKQLNLLHDWPMRNKFDFIFCRNVVIYFSKDTQRTLFARFADQLHNDGHLFIGHSETLYKITDQFRLLGKTIYYKT